MAFFIDPQPNRGLETLIEVSTQYFFCWGIPWVEFYQDRFEVLQVESPILSLFLLVLRIPLNLSPNAGYKGVGFSKALPEKDFEIVPSKGDGIVTFNLSLLLLLVEVDSISEKQGRKRDALETRGIAHIEMVLALSIEVVPLYIRASIVQVGISGLQWLVLSYRVCLKLTMLLASNKQF